MVDYTVGREFQLNNDRAPQATITVNCDFDERIVLLRTASANSASDQENVIGKGVVDSDRLQIRPGEFCFFDTQAPFRPQPNSAKGGVVAVFTSFAGIKYPKRISQTMFDRRFRYVGVAQVPADPSGKINSSSGVSVRKGGAASLVNTSGRVILPGQILRARLPSVNLEEREQQYSHVWGYNNRETHILGKPVATLDVVDYREIADEFDTVVAKLFTNYGRINLPHYLSLPPYNIEENYDTLTQEAADAKLLLALSMFSGVVAAMEKGLVVPTSNDKEIAVWRAAGSVLSNSKDSGALMKHTWVAPGTSINPVDVRNLIQASQEVNTQTIAVTQASAAEIKAVIYNELRAKVNAILAPAGRNADKLNAINALFNTNYNNTKNDIEQAITAAVTAPAFVTAQAPLAAASTNQAALFTKILADLATAQEGFVPITSPIELDARANEHKATVQNLAVLFGIAAHPSASDLTQNNEDSELGLAGLTRILYGSTNGLKKEVVDKIREYVLHDLPQPSQSQTPFGDRSFSSSSFAKRVELVYNNASPNFARMMGRKYDSLFRCVVGTALTQSRANEVVDYAA